MSQKSLEDEPSDIHVKRPFMVKTFRELDRHQNDINKKMRKKQHRTSHTKDREITSLDQFCSPKEEKMLSKMPQFIRNGNRIVGEWKKDQLHGLAQIFYHNGIYFKGHYLNGIKVNGHFKFKSGFQYVGKCFGNKFAGEGMLIFPNGKTIEGEWKDFEVMGKGKISYPKGEVYYGEIKDFRKHGKGYFYFSDGSKYQGEFVDGLITGQGSYYVEDKLVSAGKWLNGELEEEEALDKQKLHFGSTMIATVSQKEDNPNCFQAVRQKNTMVACSKSKSNKKLEEPKEVRKVHFN